MLPLVAIGTLIWLAIVAFCAWRLDRADRSRGGLADIVARGFARDAASASRYADLAEKSAIRVALRTAGE